MICSCLSCPFWEEHTIAAQATPCRRKKDELAVLEMRLTKLSEEDLQLLFGRVLKVRNGGKVSDMNNKSSE